MIENSFDKIKKLMKIIGGKAIIVENGEPVFVIVNVDEYTDFRKTENIASHSENRTNHPEEEEINKNVEIWKARQTQKRLKQFKAEDNFMGLDDEKITSDEITVEKL